MKKAFFLLLFTAGTLNSSSVQREIPNSTKKLKERALITFDQFMGVNAFVDDPIDKMQAVGFIREYHNWGWDEGNGKEDYQSYPTNNIKWAPSEVKPWNFDTFYSQVSNAGLIISPCIQGSVNWLNPGAKFKSSNKPLDEEGLPATDPFSYHKKAHYMFQFAARYGFTHVDEQKLTLASGQARKSGMGLVRYLEDWNEQDKDWEGREAQFTPQEYASMLSANYDGHANTMTSGSGTFGIKNADPRMKVVMGGLASPSVEYIQNMKTWFEENRTDKKFAADVINVHQYTWKDGKGWQGGGPALSPEEGELKDLMQTFVEYRNKNLPEVEIWISEFGWDTHPKSPLSPPPIGPFDIFEVQAQWLVRAYLAFAAAGVDRAQMYMLRDVDPKDSTWFSTSGLVGPKGDWTPKKSWYYVHTLKNTLKNMRFIGEQPSLNPKLLIYKFKDINNSKGAYVIWAATKENYTVKNYPVSLPSKTKTAKLVQLVSNEISGKSTSLSIAKGQVKVDVCERPIFILVDNMM